MKSLVILLLSSLTLLTTSSFTPAEHSEPHTIIEEFHFFTNDGCGEYFVSGDLVIRFNENGLAHFMYEGTAVSVETGEEVPLHVRSIDKDSKNGFISNVNGVFPGVMQFHYQVRVKFHPEFFVHYNDFSHCIKGS